MMFGRTRPTARRMRGLALGSSVTVIGCASFAVGWLQSLDNLGLDLHFRHFGSIQADPRIVLLDIDDGALRNEPWPWPRRRFAEIVSTLHELGADRIALDLLFAEPHAPRRGGAAMTPNYDVEPQTPILGDPREDPTIFDDAELRDAITSAGNVYLAMFAPTTPPHIAPDTIWNQARRAVRERPNASFAEFTQAVRAGHPRGTRWLFHTAVIANLVENDFTLSEDRAVALLRDREGFDEASIRANYAPAKRLVAREAARVFLKNNPEGGIADFLRRTLSAEALTVISPDRAMLIAAYRAEDARRAVLAKAPKRDASLTPALVHAYNVSWPLDRFARAARGVGMVAYNRTRTGARRTSPPLHGEGIIPSDPATRIPRRV